ncbi:unnamed protein product [Scytosiphon promiscuus]
MRCSTQICRAQLTPYPPIGASQRGRPSCRQPGSLPVSRRPSDTRRRTCSGRSVPAHGPSRLVRIETLPLPPHSRGYWGPPHPRFSPPKHTGAAKHTASAIIRA